MEFSLLGLRWMRHAGLGLALAVAPLAACAGDTTDPNEVSPLTDDLKGGVPAAGQGKGKGRGRPSDGAAGGAPVVDDAGVETPGKGQGKGKDKVKKEKKAKDDAAPGGGADEDTDEDADEATDEPAKA